MSLDLVNECNGATRIATGDPLAIRARSSRASFAMTRFIAVRLRRHRLVFGTQSGEYVLGRCHTTSVRIGNSAGKGGLERSEPYLTLMQQAQTLPQDFALRVIAAGCNELCDGKLLELAAQINTAWHGASPWPCCTRLAGTITVIKALLTQAGTSRLSPAPPGEWPKKMQRMLCVRLNLNCPDIGGSP